MGRRCGNDFFRTASKKYEIAKKDYWKRENLSVVAFVYHETEGVIHVTECPVI